MKSVLRGIILFFITFIIGSLFASFYFLKKDLPLAAEPQQFSNNVSQIKSYDLPKCVAPIVELNHMKVELLKEKQDLLSLLVDRKDLSEKQKSEAKKKLVSTMKKIEEIEIQIEEWRLWEKFRKENLDDGELAVKLLHKEPCYDF